jgi:hypothetical protein
MKVRESLVICATVLSTLAPPTLAQNVLDPPELTVVDRGFFRITIQVQAGASGAPAGFAIDWMTAEDYHIYGWPEDEYGPYSEYCDFTGAPTLNPSPDGSSYALGPNGTITIQLGDLFDETGVYATYSEGLPPNTTYVVRAHAEGDDTHVESGYSNTIYVSTTDAECTQGFWKNHFELWPSGCFPMLLGNVAYTAADILAIYNTPANGNGLIFLAHQLITVQLNYCNGSNLSNISQDVADAHTLIGNLVVPTGYLAPNACSDLTETLDEYNNGLISGVVNCPVPVQPTTWGAIKSLHR